MPNETERILYYANGPDDFDMELMPQSGPMNVIGTQFEVMLKGLEGKDIIF